MVTPQVIQEQLKRIDFKVHGWGSAEVRELPNIILPDEQIYEVVNGFYDGGFALLVATDIRVLLVDKKPFNYLTVEDLRFDMINEIDYSHRFIGSNITIATGNRNLVFHSYNQPRLRKLIGHVQDCMASAKKQTQYMRQDQNQHLEEINQRLQAYLIAQHEHQAELEKRLAETKSINQKAAIEETIPEPPKLDNALSDYLYAQRLLAEHNAKNSSIGLPSSSARTQVQSTTQKPDPAAGSDVIQQEILADGVKEVFGKPAAQQQASAAVILTYEDQDDQGFIKQTLSRMPLLLRNRRFGRPHFHDHSQTEHLRPQPDGQLPS